MVYLVVCSKCGKSHTKKELIESKFCRECGKFLSSRNKVKVFSSKEKKVKNEKNGMFPYKPYPQQLEFMKDIKDIIGVNGVLIAEACNGFGKTVCVLVSTLSSDKKILYATRTHEQVRQVLFEVERINKSANNEFSAVNLASRQYLCLNKKCKGLNSIEAMEACRLLKEAGQCDYKTEIRTSKARDLKFPSVFSIRRLRRWGRLKRICPYFLARIVASYCHVIVAPYQYVFNEHIRRQVKLDLSNRVLVFDEAHNADQIGQEALSSILSERTLNNAKRELEEEEISVDFIDQLLNFLENKVSKEIISEPGLMLHKDLKLVLRVKKLASFTSKFIGLVEKIRARKMERGDYPICFLNGVLNFLKRIDTSPGKSYVAVYRKSLQGFNLLEYRCLDPSLAIKPVVKEALGALIMSGTLSPLELFAEVLGLEDTKLQAYSAIVAPENVRTIIDLTVTTRFKERSEDMIRQYGRNISKLVYNVPNGVLVFFPQKRFMLECLNAWRRIGLIKKIGIHTLFNGKRLFLEGASALENRKIVEEYKRNAKSDRGAVLCGVFRGRNAEGSNFPYEEARGVLLIGVPYADYSDPVVRAQIDYFNSKRRSMGKRWYIMDAFRAANQAMGRGIRHLDDWCNFILMDKRYGKNINFISKWAVANNIETIS
jgi:DNA excision repair protein ERCC-2